MTDKQLIRVSSGFRRGLIGPEDGTMRCAMVSYSLAGYLSFVGVACETEEVLLEKCNHVFIRLKDGRVLDGTADQFGGPKVYLGEPLWFHKEGGKP